MRNTIIAVLLSFIVIVGWSYFNHSMNPVSKTESSSRQSSSGQPQASAGQSTLSRNTADSNVERMGKKIFVSKQDALKQPRLTFANDHIKGSILKKGLIFDQLNLKNYYETIKDGKNVQLLHPYKTLEEYYVSFSFISSDPKIQLPNQHTVWSLVKHSNKTLSNTKDVTFTYKTKQGLEFFQTFHMDDQYLITVTQKVINHSGKSVMLTPVGRIIKSSKAIDETSKQTYYYVHEGPLLMDNGSLKELSYDDIDQATHYKSSGGWLGFTTKYWLVALTPFDKQPYTFNFQSFVQNNVTQYGANYFAVPLMINPGKSKVLSSRFFAGVKKLQVLASYKKKYHIANFDRAIDFGWLYFLTKPFMWVLIYLASWTGSIGVAVLILTVLIRLLLFPLARKSYLSIAHMKTIQPQIKALKASYGKDRVGLTKATQALYKKHKVQPAQGCVMAIIQIPIFFALYKVFLNTIEMRHAHFLWVSDLSAPSPHGLLELFGLIQYQVPSIVHWLNIGILPIVLGITIYFQQRLSSTNITDPLQKRMFMVLPFVFVFLFAAFPLGLVIYWIWNNILSIGQQIYFMRTQHVPIFEDEPAKKKN